MRRRKTNTKIRFYNELWFVPGNIDSALKLGRTIGTQELLNDLRLAALCTYGGDDPANTYDTIISLENSLWPKPVTCFRVKSCKLFTLFTQPCVYLYRHYLYLHRFYNTYYMCRRIMLIYSSYTF